MSRSQFRNPRSKRPQRNETTSRNEDAKEILPENRSRQGPEIGANPDGSGRDKIPGFGGRQNLVTFQLKSCLKFDDFGSEQAPGPFGGFSGRPRRDVRRAARRDLHDDQRHDPRALVQHVSVLCTCLRFSLVRFFFVTSSSVRFSFCVQRSDWIFLRPEVGSENSNPTFGRSRWTRSRRRSSRSSSLNRRRSILGIESSTHSKTCAPPRRPLRRRPLRRHDPKHNVKNPIGTAAAARTRIPNPTSGHQKVKVLIQPLDT